MSQRAIQFIRRILATLRGRTQPARARVCFTSSAPRSRWRRRLLHRRLDRWWLFPLALIPGYGAAWIGHFFIEKNKPATFQYPLWSFMGDYKMIWMMLTGRMSDEVEERRQQEERGQARLPDLELTRSRSCDAEP